ncbi:hypothetical protein L6164_008485 [Bauhinia variegata]|uniref:Uncharacterized protein n=1 Tax=Bauhinia variegata TaxID=167791 RepID=A0ACB9PFS7_BAUVA|nr:hypothetical protein L6164_008485 [Bauhinia variegata]
MKGMMKGKLLKKLKSIRPIEYLKQDRVLQVKALDGYVESLTKTSSFSLRTPFVSRENEPREIVPSCGKVQEPEIIDVAELMRDLEDDEMDLDDENDDKENIGPSMQNPKVQKDFTAKDIKTEAESKQIQISEGSRLSEPGTDNQRQTPLSEVDISSFRRPDLNSGSLFDPNLLAAFEQAVKEHIRMIEAAERRTRVEEFILESNEEEEEQEQEPPSKSRRIEEHAIDDPLVEFEEKCPPGGSDSVILYTTTLRGIRKTFEDCNRIRFLLDNFHVVYFERDTSMHMEFKEELWKILDGKIVPPRLFVKGRDIGGAEQVLALHEQGKLRPLFEGIPIDNSTGPCEACGGFRFVLCFNCNGSHRVMAEENQEKIQCSNCNENGLIICPYCC